MSRVTVVGMVVNVVLSALKLVVGYMIGSLALVADGYHSLSDLISDVMVLTGAWFSGKPPDEEHPYGHGKFETIAAGGVALALVIIGGLLAWKGFSSLMRPAEPVRGSWVIIIALISVVSKEWLYEITVKLGRQLHSASLVANAWHHRSDALSSAVVVLAGAAELAGVHHADGVAGVIVGLMVAGVGVKVSLGAIQDLCEVSAGDDLLDSFREAISRISEVRGWHRLRVRRIGRELDLDVHILLDSQLSIHEGHEIVTRLEDSLKRATEWTVNFTIHVDPDEDLIREASVQRFDSVIRSGHPV